MDPNLYLLKEELSTESVNALYSVLERGIDNLSNDVLKCTTGEERASEKLILLKAKLEGGQKLYTLFKQEITRLRQVKSSASAE